jgi:flagellar hook-associated protein 3 FlgL
MTGSLTSSACAPDRADHCDTSTADALGWLATADAAFGHLDELLRRARAALVPVLGARKSAPLVADRIDAVRAAVLSVANTTHLGRPIFGGSCATEFAYDSAARYLGDDGVVFRCVGPHAIVRINQTGAQVFGPGGADVFSLLASISAGMRGDPAGLRGSLAGLDHAIALVGAAQECAAAARRRIQHVQAAHRSGLRPTAVASGESVDLAELELCVASAHASYQAALETHASVRQLSLIEFLD